MPKDEDDWMQNMLNSVAKVEPAANMRTLAKYNFEIYQAHVEAGFTPEQATGLVYSMMTAVMLQAMNEDDA